MDGATSDDAFQILPMPGVRHGEAIHEHADVDARELRPQFALARAMVAFGLGTGIGAVTLLSLGYLPPLAMLACIPLVCGMVLGLIGCFQSDPVLSLAAHLTAEADELSAHLIELGQERTRRAKLCRDLEIEMKRDRSTLIVRRNALEAEGRRRQAQIRAVYDETKQQLLRRLQTMCEATDRELKALDQRRQTAEVNYRTDLAGLADQGEREAATIIGEIEREAIAAHLSQTRICREELPDLNEELLARLIFQGITRASDVTFDRLASVPGMGTLETLALCGWRTRQEDLARQDCPGELPAEETHAILTRYHAFKKHLEAERHASMARITMEEQAIRARRKNETLELERQLGEVRQHARKSWRQINEEYAARFHGDAAAWLDGSSERRDRYRQAATSETEMALELADDRQRLGEIEHERRRLANWTLSAYVRGVFFLGTPVESLEEEEPMVRSTPTLLRGEATMVLAFADAFQKKDAEKKDAGERRAA